MKICEIGKENGVILASYDARDLRLADEYDPVQLAEMMTWGEIKAREDLEPVAELIRRGGVLDVEDSDPVYVYISTGSEGYEIYAPEWWY